MKKLFSILAAGLLMCSIAACSTSEPTDSEVSQSSESSGSSAVEPTDEPSEASDATPPAESEKEVGEAHEITYSKAVTWVDSIGSPWVQVIAEITNTGSENLYLSSGSFDLEDEDGALVKSISMASAFPDVIAPGEKGYMCEVTMLDAAVDGTLTVLPREQVAKAKVDLIRYETSEVTVSDSDFGGIKVMGRVENTGEEAANMTYIAAVLYDAEGNPLAVEFTILSDELAPGDKVGFEMSSLSLPDSVTADMVADYTVYAYPMQMQF